jgi:uncharacterized phage protein gp47/JayE
MTFGLTPEGFNTKRLSDILEEAETNLSTITDPQSEQTLQPDFDSNDPAMQIVKVPLDGLGAAWEGFQAVADQYDPNNASGPLLASLVQLNGITKDDGTPSSVAIQMVGPPASPVAAGQLISDINSTTIWVTDEDVVLDGGGLANSTASSQENGPFEAAPGTITQLLTASALTAVTNTASSILGESVESDEDLRTRRSQSTLAPAVTPAEAIWANLRNLDGVLFVRVLSNRTLIADGNGLPGKSIAAVIVGGDDTDIATVLLARTSDAAEWFGNTSKTLFDLQGEPYVIKWVRPDDLDIFVEVDVTVINSGTWPSDGDVKIQEAVVAYSIGGAPALGIDEGFREVGFLPGVDVESSRLYTPINSVPGHRITGLRVGITVSPGVVASVPVAFDEQSRFDVSRIVVNVS